MPSQNDSSQSTDQRPETTLFVLFGATGDLAKRMVLPAFYELEVAGLLPRTWRLIGNGRGDVSHWDFRSHFHDALTEFATAPDPAQWESFQENLFFAGGGFDSDDPGSLLEVIEDTRKQMGQDAQLVHYLAVPPVAFGKLTEALGEHDLAHGARVVYEKPFGTSPEKFRDLDSAVHKVLDESQVYRIDHFLGKEATQNLHVLRFANGLIDAIWNNQHVESVQIDVPETLDIADRAEFYDATGAVLDMLVTHLFQVAAEIAMEPPLSLGAEDLQTARESVIGAFRPLNPDEVVLGQYDGYRQTPGIDPHSERDTFVAARLWIDTDRWRDVPFLLRTGKKMAKGAQTVSLVLRKPDGPITHLPDAGNVLQISLAGSGDVSVQFVVKQPGAELHLVDGSADLALASLPDAQPLSPYARLIHDVLSGDRSLFTRPDGLQHVWDVATPLLDHRPPVQPYPDDSWGPTAANALAGPGGWVLGQSDPEQPARQAAANDQIGT